MFFSASVPAISRAPFPPAMTRSRFHFSANSIADSISRQPFARTMTFIPRSRTRDRCSSWMLRGTRSEPDATACL